MWKKVLVDKEMQRKEAMTQASKRKPKELIQESKEAKDKGSIAVLHKCAG